MVEPSRCGVCEEVGSDEGDVSNPIGAWWLEPEVSIINSGSWGPDNDPDMPVEVLTGFDDKLSQLGRLSWDLWVVRVIEEMAVELVWDGRINGKGVRSRGVGPK